MLQMQLLSAPSAPDLLGIFYANPINCFFAPKNVLQLRQKLLHHTNVRIVKFMAHIYVVSQAVVKIQHVSHFFDIDNIGN